MDGGYAIAYVLNTAHLIETFADNVDPTIVAVEIIITVTARRAVTVIKSRKP